MNVMQLRYDVYVPLMVKTLCSQTVIIKTRSDKRK
jgi:hypothetical protein